ncbi:uncharacterized protein EV420DRAFT_1275651, partial [Desarmillaria tabescens]
PAVWGNLSTSAKSYFLHHMYQSFPELLFCKGHWKVLRIATNNYSQWHSKALKKQKATSRSGQDRSAHGHHHHSSKNIGKRVISLADREEGALELAPKRVRTESSTHHDGEHPSMELDDVEDCHGSQVRRVQVICSLTLICLASISGRSFF